MQLPVFCWASSSLYKKEELYYLREFQLSNDGIEIVDVYLGPSGMLTGSARVSQIALEKAQELMRQQEIEQKQKEIERKRKTMEAQIAEIKSHFEAEEEELENIIKQEKLKEKVREKDRIEMAKMRKAD